MMRKTAALVATLLFACNATAQAQYDWQVQNARVTSIEVTYMPSAVLFSIDAAAGSCPAGGFLRWNGYGADAPAKQSNVKSIFAALVSAKMSGTTIRVYGVNTNCEVKFFYLG